MTSQNKVKEEQGKALGTCTNGMGIRQKHDNEGRLLTPNGARCTQMCRACAQVVIDEYREKLGEVWTFAAGPA